MESNRLSKSYRGAGYLRLSKEDSEVTGRENLQSNSIENQKEYIEEFVKGKPEIELVSFYQDDGYSGVNFERPAFQKMMQDIRDNQIDCIIVKDLSRLGRNYIEVGKYLERLFPLLGVRFIAINDSYDSADEKMASNNLIVPFKNLINDAYCRDISIKIRSHLEVKRKRGEFIGAFAVYGYQRGENKNKLIIDSYAAEIVKEIFHMKMDGMSQQAIADELNDLGVLSPAEYKRDQGSGYKAVFQKYSKAKWTAMAILRILKNEVYIGNLVQGKASTPNYKVKVRELKPESEWIRVENTHEAIISQSDFEIVEDILQKDTRVMGGKGLVSLYSGYLFCADCGCSMVRKTVYSGSIPYIYYICSGNKKDKEVCDSHSISEIILNNVVSQTLRLHMKYLFELQESVYKIGASFKKSDKERLIVLQSEKQKDEIEKYQKLKLECYEDYKKGIITQEEYIFFKEELGKRVQDAEDAICELKKKKQLFMETRIQNEAWMKEFVNNKNSELKRSLLVRFVKQIYVYKDHRVEIIFRYGDMMSQMAELIEDVKSSCAFEEVV